jgi:hypothetical protein
MVSSKIFEISNTYSIIRDIIMQEPFKTACFIAIAWLTEHLDIDKIRPSMGHARIRHVKLYYYGGDNNGKKI